MTKKQKTTAGIICLLIVLISPVFVGMDSGEGIFLFIITLLTFGSAADILLTEN